MIDTYLNAQGIFIFQLRITYLKKYLYLICICKDTEEFARMPPNGIPTT